MSAMHGDAAATSAPLTALDQQILAFEREWWRYSGAKEQAIKDTFDMTPARYYQELSRIMEDPAALAHDPLLVKRLIRLRAQRHTARTGRPVAG
ncbi:MAG: hypothetical protein RL745_912 [Actinomycetota bacterium]|jgi:hypothetical protein